MVFAEHPLASGFPITDGSVQVVVPSVVDRDDYVIVRTYLFSKVSIEDPERSDIPAVFGDSGNTSPKFTITSTSASASV